MGTQTLSTDPAGANGDGESSKRLRIVHLSDIHFWRIAFKLSNLLNKRAVGTLHLLMGRARRFRLERASDVVDKVLERDPDHLLITGDLTTTSLEQEFVDARVGLMRLLKDPRKVSIIPGNHDRYTLESVKKQRFERAFGAFAPRPEFPWVRRLDDETAILGLDPTRPDLTAQGFLPEPQLQEARKLLAELDPMPRRLIVACHYPLAAPPLYAPELRLKRMINSREVGTWLGTIGPHLYCCGHVHVAWAYQPPEVPNQLCLNSGAPLLRDPEGYRPPGFLEIDLIGDGVYVTHHAWHRKQWIEKPMHGDDRFFGNAGRESRGAHGGAGREGGKSSP